jgi:murein L,D-transpeptidase YcbB/YkuD
MRFKILLSLYFFSSSHFLFSQGIVQIDEVTSIIRNTIEPIEPESQVSIEGNRLFSSVVIMKFYQNRAFEPAWSKNEKLSELAYEMRYEIQQAKFDGLNPEDYHLDLINFYFNKFEMATLNQASLEKSDVAFIDILLSDAYIILSSHLYLGKVNPESLNTEWSIQRSTPELKIDERLQAALSGVGLRKNIEELYPSFSIYKKMRDGLRSLHEFQTKFENYSIDSWKNLKIDKSIKPRESSKLISEIRSRLIFWNFVAEDNESKADQYDSIMEIGIKTLQRRHGMNPDGIIGQETIHALNQSPKDLIASASVNLERLRWLPRNLKDQELILVNSANFQLDYIQNRDTLLSSKVIVGKSYHSTPQFSAMMSYIVFSPTWTVPSSIVRNEIIPAIRRDNQYLIKNDMQILTNTGQIVPPSSIDWSKVNPRTFPYMIQQIPGQQNALGLVKFMFPNKYSVYIHDTPSRSLFEREDRALSHGCIRLHKPFELAKLLLSFDPKWTDGEINAAMHLAKEKTVMLDRQIPVLVVYITYWADIMGNIYFRRDIYSRDAEIHKSLLERRRT